MAQATGRGQRKSRHSRQMARICLSSPRSAFSSCRGTHGFEALGDSCTPMYICTQVAQGDIGKSMVSGEFVFMTAMHKTIPDSTPAHIAWGTYALNPNIHLLLCYFVDMIDEVPMFKHSRPKSQSFIQMVSHLLVNMDSQCQHIWAKCLNTPLGQIHRKHFSQYQWND